MRKTLIITTVVFALGLPVVSNAWVELGPKAVAGVSLNNPAGDGLKNLYIGSGLGAGVETEFSFTIIGLAVDFLYQRDNSWSAGLAGVSEVNTYRLPVNVRLHLPGMFAGAGPEWIFSGGKHYTVLNFVIGESIPFVIGHLFLETPKISVNWWDNNKTRYEFQITASLLFKIF